MTTAPLLAQIGGYSIAQLVIWLIVICAVIGIGLIAIKASGIQIPGWVIQIGWIVIVALIAICAIKFLVATV